MAVEEEMEENLVEMEENKKMMELVEEVDMKEEEGVKEREWRKKKEEHMRMVEMKESENAAPPDFKMEDKKEGREVKMKKRESAEKVSKEIEKVGLRNMKEVSPMAPPPTMPMVERRITQYDIGPFKRSLLSKYLKISSNIGPFERSSLPKYLINLNDLRDPKLYSYADISR